MSKEKERDKILRALERLGVPRKKSLHSLFAFLEIDDFIGRPRGVENPVSRGAFRYIRASTGELDGHLMHRDYALLEVLNSGGAITHPTVESEGGGGNKIIFIDATLYENVGYFFRVVEIGSTSFKRNMTDINFYSCGDLLKKITTR